MFSLEEKISSSTHGESEFNKRRSNVQDIRQKPEGVKEEDMEKYEKVIEILLAAGYFRARISTLSPFDKVIGGLCWCISNSDVDVDVDVFFEEESNIGQKIRISEQIVSSLLRMKCPYKIQAHQIQGLDFQAIYEVLQWLVKKVLEYREENKERIKNYSHLMFNRRYELPQDAEETRKYNKAVPFLESVTGIYRPKRQYKRGQNIKIKNEWGYVQSVLLEYGKELKIIVDAEVEMDEERKKQYEMEQQQKIDEISNIKKSLTSDKGKFSRANVSKMVQMGAEDIRAENVKFEEEKKKIDEESQLQGKSEKLRHTQRVTALTKKINNNMETYVELKEEYKKLKRECETKQEELDKTIEENDQLTKKIEKMKNILQNDEGLQKLQKLVSLNEALKKQEKDFRANCKRQLLELQDMISKLQSVASSDDSLVKVDQLEQAYQKDLEKMKKIKLLSAKKNREIVILQRKIDEVPTQTELIQYNKRFTELHEQVEYRLSETKKYYDMYNTFSETFEYMNKEMSLLGSIHENFIKAKEKKGQTKEWKQWMADSVQKSYEAVNKNREYVENKLNKKRAERDKLQETYNDLVAQQRAYFKAVKDFQQEMEKNGKLIKAIKRLTGKE